MNTFINSETGSGWIGLCLDNWIIGVNMTNDRNNEILRVENLTKVFVGVRALDDVTFSVEKGEIHSLIGENGAGKSTLMNCILGSYIPESGSIFFDGIKTNFKNPADALKAGVSMIHQEMSLVQTMTVAENIWLGRENELSTLGLLNEKKRRAATVELFDSLNIKIDPDCVVRNLSVAYMQLVELARAVSYNPKLLIMDEPTSALAAEEIETMFKIMRQLSSRGIAIIFISHKIDEIFEICNRVTILRDGKTIETRKCSDISYDELIRLIVGRDVSSMFVKGETSIGDTVFEVKNLCRKGVFSDISFDVKAGEIVGFSGLMGAGRSEVMRAVFGVDKYDSGEIILEGEKIKIKSPQSAVKHWIGMVTEDRLRTGIISKLSIIDNSTLAALKKALNKIGFVSNKVERSLFSEYSKPLSVKYASEKDLIGTLSGGNQQKVILSRWLMIDPKVLILDEPTRGIDVGSKSDIYALISSIASKGIAIILVSSEMPELLGICDRIYVMRSGRIVHECKRSEATQELLALKAFGESKTTQMAE